MTNPPPYPHQYRAALKYHENRQRGEGLYAVHVTGAGKSRTGVMAARMEHAKKVLVICPPIARGVWRSQVRLFWPKGRRRFTMISWGKFADTRKRLNVLEQWIVQRGFDFWIIDEAHYGKSATSARTKSLHRLAEGVTIKRGVKMRIEVPPLLLSGTPSDSPLDWWAQYHLIAPKHPMWRTRFTAYRARVAIMGGPNGNWVQGYDVDGLADALEATLPYTDVVDDLKLPAPVFTEIPLTLSHSESVAYEKMRQDLFIEMTDEDGEWDSNAATVLVKGLRLQQISSGFVRDTDGVDHRLGQTKAKALGEILASGKYKKVIVSCIFNEDNTVVLPTVERSFGVKPIHIKGGMTEKAKDKAVEQFQRAEKACVVMQPVAGGISKDYSTADCIMVYNFHPSVIVHDQLIGRAWRPPRTGLLSVLLLIAKGTTDPLLWQRLKNKQKNTALAAQIKRHLKAGRI